MKLECRVCKGKLFSSPIIKFNNIPKGAQIFNNIPSQTNSENELNIYQCSMCGLIQHISEPVPYYKEVIRAVAYSNDMKKFRLKQFKEFLEKYNLIGKKIIEIGCGKGEYLELMNNYRVEIYGVEYGEEAVNICKSKGLKVEKGYIDSEKYKLKHAPFDAFFILNFLEHIPNINEFLKGINFNLKDNGIGLIEVPNFEMILKNNLYSEFIPDHIFYFTRDTLSTTVKLNGFEVLEENIIWNDYIISMIVRKRKPIDMSNFENFKIKITNALNEFINNCNKNVAIWGAGHQALFVIFISDIKDKIKYIIDSAKFKQGKYIPKSNLKIESPEILLKDKVEGIIVMAGSYSVEVAKIIKSNYPYVEKIGILKHDGIELIK